jgi:regulator of replication initiation timing
VELYATKHQRSQISVKSKIQKIVSSHKDKLESELDNIFFKKHRQQQPGPVSVIPTTITTPIKENEDLTQIKEFLGDYLRNNARLGIEQSELRSKVPKNVIDSHTLAKVVRELEQDRKVLVRQVPGLHLDPSRLHFFDREALEHVKKVLRKKYKTGLVEGIYPLDILFEGEETLKGKVALTEFTNIRLFTFIFYVD